MKPKINLQHVMFQKKKPLQKRTFSTKIHSVWKNFWISKNKKWLIIKFPSLIESNFGAENNQVSKSFAVDSTQDSSPPFHKLSEEHETKRKLTEWKRWNPKRFCLVDEGSSRNEKSYFFLRKLDNLGFAGRLGY